MTEERHIKAREKQLDKDKNVFYSKILIENPQGQKAKW